MNKRLRFSVSSACSSVNRNEAKGTGNVKVSCTTTRNREKRKGIKVMTKVQAKESIKRSIEAIKNNPMLTPERKADMAYGWLMGWLMSAEMIASSILRWEDADTDEMTIFWEDTRAEILGYRR